MTPKKFANIQALRGVAVLLVVLFHLMVVENKYDPGNALLPKFLNIGTAGVDLFFVISGFVMVIVTRGQFQQLASAVTFFYHRITRIYPLYWFYSGLILIVYLIHPELVNASQGHQANIIKSFLLLPQDKLPLLLVGWTLIHEMYFYCIITLLLFMPEKYFKYGLIIWGLLIIAAEFIWTKNASPAFLLITHPLTFEFIAGCLIARLIYSGINKYSRLSGILGLGLLLIFYSFYYHQASNPIPDNWSRVIVFGLACMLLVYAAAALEVRGKLLPRFLDIIGNASYSIYLSHILVLSVLGRFLSRNFAQHFWIHLTILIIMLAAVIIFGSLSYRFLEKPLIRFFRDLFKNRTGTAIASVRE